MKLPWIQFSVYVSLLIASNAYFVQRIIEKQDANTTEIYKLREQVARIETHLEDEEKEVSRAKKIKCDQECGLPPISI